MSKFKIVIHSLVGLVEFIFGSIQNDERKEQQERLISVSFGKKRTSTWKQAKENKSKEMPKNTFIEVILIYFYT